MYAPPRSCHLLLLTRVAQKAQTLGVLIWFFNVSAVLYRFTSKFTKAPTADAVPVIINWQDRKYVSPAPRTAPPTHTLNRQRPVNLVNPPPTELVHTLAYQLQIVFVSIYGRLLRRIMRESADILTKLLTNLDYATRYILLGVRAAPCDSRCV